jgi:myo-inositol-1(or 4)-monophosphatase
LKDENLIREYLALAIEVAREAGDYAFAIHASDLVISSKSNEMDLVTQVDRRNETVIRDTVLARFPDHSFLGEEMGAGEEIGVDEKIGAKEEQSSSRVRWIVDPVDGTVNYAHGIPIWCVSVGVEVNGVVECGAIYNPNLSELFTVHRGQGAFLNGKPMHVSRQTNAKQGLFVTGFPYNIDENPDRAIEQFVSFLSRGLLIRRLGSAALDLAYVACGRFDGFWEVGLSPWDSAAGHLMVREAGGNVTHYDGTDYDIYRKSIIATNGMQHDMILKIIQENK